MTLFSSFSQCMRSKAKPTLKVFTSSLLSNGKRSLCSAPEKVMKNHVPEMEFETGNFTEFMMRDSGKWTSNTALVCDLTSRHVTYGQLQDNMSRWGAFLQKKGLKKGSKVALISPNAVDLIAVQYGTIRYGAVYCGINPTCTPHEIAAQIADSECNLIVCFSLLLPLAQKALQSIQQDIPVVSLGPDTGSGLPRVEDILSDKDLGFSDPAEVSGDDVMGILFSSGTTGSPKGTAITHNAGIANLQMIIHPRYLAAANSTVDCPKKYMMLLPQFHIGGFIGVAGVGLKKGLELYNLTKFDPATFLPFMMKNKITHLHLVPSLLAFALSRPEFNKENFSFVEGVLSGASPVPPTVVLGVRERLGEDVHFQSTYGMTEALVTTMDPLSGLELGYTGQSLPTVETKVIDLYTGKSLGPGEEGEICLRSVCRMKEYINNPKATAETVDSDGWVHSGDVGSYNEEGFLQVVDRTKELIKVNAMQVSPSEIESVILKIPGVTEVSVIGVPDEKLGEAPRAYVIAKDLKEQQVIDHVKAYCAKHKHLRGGVRFISQLPKNATGKVMRKELVKMAQEE